MVPLRRTISTVRASFFLGLWGIVAAGFVLWFIRTLNIGYFLLGIAILFIGGLTTRAPDERRVEGLKSQFGQLVAMLAAVFALVGITLVMTW